MFKIPAMDSDWLLQLRILDGLLAWRRTLTRRGLFVLKDIRSSTA